VYIYATPGSLIIYKLLGMQREMVWGFEITGRWDDGWGFSDIILITLKGIVIQQWIL